MILVYSQIRSFPSLYPLNKYVSNTAVDATAKLPFPVCAPVSQLF